MPIRMPRGLAALALAPFCALWLAALPQTASAAQTVHLTLTIDGNDIEGESTVASLDRDGTIECYSFSHNGFSAVDSKSGQAGPRQHRPLTITKPVDKSSPLLWKAWSNNELVDVAEFRFYRPDCCGSEEHFLTVKLTNGAIVGMAVASPDAMDPDLAPRPPTEVVTFTYQTIEWEYVNGGVTHTDTWQ
jgi:type VI secretion system secreted protein Hcp